MLTRAPRYASSLILLAFAGGFSLSAGAQTVPADEVARVFNELFNVGGIGDRDPGNFIGSVGCGSGTGTTLTNSINSATGEQVSDRALADAQRNATRDLWRYCDNLTTNNAAWSQVNIKNGADGSVNEERLQSSALAPDELFAQIDQAAAMTRAQLGNVGARLRGVRLAALGFDTDARYAKANRGRLDFAEDGSVQVNSGLNAGDASGSGSSIGFFANGRFVDVQADGSGVETGSETDGFGFTAGIDYAFSANFIGGFGIGYTDLETTYDTFGAGTAANIATGDSAVTNLAYQLFFSYFPNENLYFDGVFGISQLEFDFQKNVPAFDMGQNNADNFAPLTSSPDGDTSFFNVGVGYDLRKPTFTVTPYLRVEYLKTEIDGFTEQSMSADNTLALTVSAQENTSLASTLGATIAWPISAKSGVYMPYLRGEFVHEFDEQSDKITGFLAALPDATFTLTPTATDENYGYLGVGLAGTFANNFAVFADYDMLVGFDDLDNWQFTLGLRKQF